MPQEQKCNTRMAAKVTKIQMWSGTISKNWCHQESTIYVENFILVSETGAMLLYYMVFVYMQTNVYKCCPSQYSTHKLLYR